MKAQNTKLQKLEHIPNTIKHLTWLADGRLAYTVKDERDRSSDPRLAPLLSITDLAGTETKWFSMVLKGGILASPTDSGRILVIGDEYIEMWTLDHDHNDWILPSTYAVYRIKCSSYQENSLATWSANGQLLAVAGKLSHMPRSSLDDIYIFDPDLNLVRRHELEQSFQHLTWQPNNEIVVCYTQGLDRAYTCKTYSHSYVENRNLGILEYRLKSGQICFTAITESEGGITDFCYHTPERPMMILQRYYATSDMGSYRWSRWSPDGTWIIYNSHLLKVVRLYNVDTEEMFTVEHESLDLSQATPSWSNDSRYCALATEEGVYILDVCAP